MQVCVPSTPAQMFHMLRRQMVRSFRKPLIVMTPKSLLRHKLSVSAFDELTRGEFQCVLNEIDDLPPKDVTRVVFCSGKVYFDLLEARRADEARNVAIVRIEQLYPFPAEDYAAALAHYPNVREIVWCQEEPQNQGAWYQIRHRLQDSLKASRCCCIRAGARPPPRPPAYRKCTRRSSTGWSPPRSRPRRRNSPHARPPGCAPPAAPGRSHEHDDRSSCAATARVGGRCHARGLAKQPGDAVDRDENLVDLETDKVVLEVPAPASGVLRELKAKNGATVTGGQILAVIEEGARFCNLSRSSHLSRCRGRGRPQAG